MRSFITCASALIALAACSTAPLNAKLQVPADQVLPDAVAVTGIEGGKTATCGGVFVTPNTIVTTTGAFPFGTQPETGNVLAADGETEFTVTSVRVDGRLVIITVAEDVAPAKLTARAPDIGETVALRGYRFSKPRVARLAGRSAEVTSTVVTLDPTAQAFLVDAQIDFDPCGSQVFDGSGNLSGITDQVLPEMRQTVVIPASALQAATKL